MTIRMTTAETTVVEGMVSIFTVDGWQFPALSATLPLSFRGVARTFTGPGGDMRDLSRWTSHGVRAALRASGHVFPAGSQVDPAVVVAIQAEHGTHPPGIQQPVTSEGSADYRWLVDYGGQYGWIGRSVVTQSSACRNCEATRWSTGRATALHPHGRDQPATPRGKCEVERRFNETKPD
jgi:hypothetical protein